MLPKTLIYGLLIMSLFSCQETLQKIEVFDDNNQLDSMYYIDADKQKQGLLFKYYDDSKVSLQEEYINGAKHGERILYHPNGKKEIIARYINGNIDGPYQEYDNEGNLMIETQYVKGVLTGIFKKYYKSGILQEEVHFKNNEENGPFKEYYDNGQLQWQGNYLNGDNEIGLLIEYSEKGDTLKKMWCDSSSLCRTFWSLEKGKILDIEF